VKGRSRSIMNFHNIIWHTDGRCRSPIYRGTAIHRAGGWGNIHRNCFISIMALGGARSGPGYLSPPWRDDEVSSVILTLTALSTPQFSSQYFADERFGQGFAEFQLFWNLIGCQFTLAIGKDILAGLL
jgi:hypothetical protein